MPVSEEQRYKFFVYVVESPSPQDLYHRRSEGQILQQAVNLNQIPCSVVTAVNHEMFEAALKTSIINAMDTFPGMAPIIHISAHGYAEGIQLSNGEIITWAQLRLYLAPINDALNGLLIVCLSCCEGYSGIRMAMHLEDSALPFYALVTNTGKPLWSDTAVAYSSFYHLMSKGEYITDTVNAMKVASGNTQFVFETAESSRRAYLNHISSLNTYEAQSRIEESMESEEPSHLAKMRKFSQTARPSQQ